MTKENIIVEENKNEDREERIYFGQKKITCFACGEEIDENYEVCPYCGTKQKLK